jgi:hypothetical protein
MTTNTKQIRVTYQTPAFRLSYPALFEAVETLNGDKKFMATMLFPKADVAAKFKAEKHPASTWMPADNMKALYQEVVRVARSNFGPDVELGSLKLPKFRDGDKVKDNGKIDENEKGYIVIRTTSKEKPKCLRQDKTVIGPEGSSELYPGCWVRAVLTIAPFLKPNHGVTVYLAGIQKLADDAAFSSRPRVEDEFDAVASSPSAPAGAAAGEGAVTKNPWED